MELVTVLVSAFVGMSAAFFLALGIIDQLPEVSIRGIRRSERPLFRTLSVARDPLIPRRIRQTILD